MSNSQRLIDAITWKIKQNATSIDCLQDFTGAMVRVIFNKNKKKVHLSSTSDSEFETSEKK